MKTYHHLLPLATLLLVSLLAQASPTLEDDAWLNDDSEARAAAVNEGELVFLAQPPDGPVHHHHNRVVLHPSSLDDGWVTLQQCHQDLDPVPRAQVVYNEHRTRRLAVVSYQGIEAAWVEDDTVQLKNIGKAARLCIRAETRTLEANEDGSFSLHNGPFMRRFLDGYYPMRVSMDIEMPEDYLRFVGTSPTDQNGFRVWENAQGVHFDAWFEGRLHTEVRFEADFCKSTDPARC